MTFYLYLISPYTVKGLVKYLLYYVPGTRPFIEEVVKEVVVASLLGMWKI